MKSMSQLEQMMAEQCHKPQEHFFDQRNSGTQFSDTELQVIMVCGYNYILLLYGNKNSKYYHNFNHTKYSEKSFA